MRDARTEDEASAKIAAVALAGLLLAGGGVAIAMDDGGAPPGQLSASSTEEEKGDVSTPDPARLDWNGTLSYTLCVPSGPNACTGTAVGDADDRYDTRVASGVSTAELVMSWDPITPATEVLEITLASGHTEQCGDAGTCYYWHPLVTVQGTSPLKVDATDLDLQPDDTLWLLVDQPDRTPSPVHSDVDTRQAFHVTGSVQPAEAP